MGNSSWPAVYLDRMSRNPIEIIRPIKEAVENAGLPYTTIADKDKFNSIVSYISFCKIMKPIAGIF